MGMAVAMGIITLITIITIIIRTILIFRLIFTQDQDRFTHTLHGRDTVKG